MRQLNTHLTEADIRESIPTDIFGVAQYLRERGWALSISGSTHVDTAERYIVSSSCHTWQGLPISEYTLAYYAPNGEESAITATARKLTELCLRLHETFPAHLPASHVDDSGVITEDPVGTTKMQEGPMPLLQYLQEQLYLRHTPADAGEVCRLDRGFIRNTMSGQELLLSAQDVAYIKEVLHDHANS